jgi:hypothetical protein
MIGIQDETNLAHNVCIYKEFENDTNIWPEALYFDRHVAAKWGITFLFTRYIAPCLVH